ncbi:ADP-ribosylation factor-related protein 1 isoform X3 [Enhydra lutris kenyoni]|uniref:ADP-ribosylation factor-related protein 1 isoform X3 n=1 Tax=Enhydra lutris kenyoni TaxID=391180 RepID=A0A2Y9IPU8_ENHLU|nr:ADP-ribosylation factor-related protein 1 isoform X3 [Enhydra lutris kenyoni]
MRSAGSAGTVLPSAGASLRPVGLRARSARGQRRSAGSGARRLRGPDGREGRMYTLLSGLYKYMFQKDEYCILILGLDNAGKTTFLEQLKTRFNKNYKGMSLSKITTTVGLNIGTVDVAKARLMFWDLGGQEELQSLWDKMRRGDCRAWHTEHFWPLFLEATSERSACGHSTTRSATASSTSSIPRTRRGWPSPSERLRGWSQVRRWTASLYWCWPTNRTSRPLAAGAL